MDCKPEYYDYTKAAVKVNGKLTFIHKATRHEISVIRCKLHNIYKAPKTFNSYRPTTSQNKNYTPHTVIMLDHCDTRIKALNNRSKVLL